MGSCLSKEKPAKAVKGKEANDTKDSTVKLETNVSNSTSTSHAKVLLLGSGESGKSTIVKQMKILHELGYSNDELLEYKPFVYKNTLDSVKSIIHAIIDLHPTLINNENQLDWGLNKGVIGSVTGGNGDTSLAADGTAVGALGSQIGKNGLNGGNSLNGTEIGTGSAVGGFGGNGGNSLSTIDNVKGITVNQAGNDDNELSNDIQIFNGTNSREHILNYNDLNDILDYEIQIDSDELFSKLIANKISNFYNIPEVQSFIKNNQGKFYLPDSTSYFLSQIDRISEPNYLPSVSDVLRTRKKTSGIFDFKFQMGNGLNIHMYDVGGQRSERRKWIHCFDNVTLIIFCVALSEYDQVLLEENSQNRLEESLTLFDSVVNSRWFARTSVVLFLNKIDVFAEKLPYSPLEEHFPDYTGGSDINKAAKYILWRFTQVNRSGLNIYPHVTQATDTTNIQLVFAAVKETILENSLRDSGIL